MMGIKWNFEVFKHERNIPWQNLVGYSSDNANVMVGSKNSVLSRVREQQPNVISLGCICHIANTCTQYGLKKLPVAVEDLLIDVYYHFQHSAKRREVCREFLAFTDTEEYKLVKHCSTRWLSLHKCAKRLLQQWPALRSYFNSHDESEKKGTRIHRCATSLSDPVMQLTYHFLVFIFEPLNEFNTMFQAGDSMVGYLHAEMERLLKMFLAKFVKMSTISATEHVTQVDFKNPSSQHDNDLLAVGMGARQFIEDNSDIISPTQLATFFSGVRAFYVEVTSKMVDKFPFKDETLKALGYLNPNTKADIDAYSVEKLARRLSLVDDDNCEQLTAEVHDYQLTPLSVFPRFNQEASEDNPMVTPLDCWWADISNMKTPLNKPRFPLLSKVSLAALSLPHSNSDPERCFSILRKIQRDSRDNLAQDTVNALISCKLNSINQCTEFIPTKDLCSAAKKASL